MRGPASVRRLRALERAAAQRREQRQSPRLGVARRDVAQHARREQAHHQRRAAVADERQRQPLGRQRAQHDADVDQRLQPEHRGDAEGQVAAERVARAERRAQPAPDQHAEQPPTTNSMPEQPQLLADDGQDEVGVRLGQEEQLLPAVAEAQAGDAARADADQRLGDLVADVVAERHGSRKASMRRMRHGVDDDELPARPAPRPATRG